MKHSTLLWVLVTINTAVTVILFILTLYLMFVPQPDYNKQTEEYVDKAIKENTEYVNKSVEKVYDYMNEVNAR